MCVWVLENLVHGVHTNMETRGRTHDDMTCTHDDVTCVFRCLRILFMAYTHTWKHGAAQNKSTYTHDDVTYTHTWKHGAAPNLSTYKYVHKPAYTYDDMPYVYDAAAHTHDDVTHTHTSRGLLLENLTETRYTPIPQHIHMMM